MTGWRAVARYLHNYLTLPPYLSMGTSRAVEAKKSKNSSVAKVPQLSPPSPIHVHIDTTLPEKTGGPISNPV